MPRVVSTGINGDPKPRTIMSMARQRYDACLNELVRLLASGSTYPEIAVALRVSATTAGRWARRSETLELVAAMGDRSTPAAVSAIGTLQGLLLSADERIRLAAATEILKARIEIVPIQATPETETPVPEGMRIVVPVERVFPQ